jgi:hypothetical protein
LIERERISKYCWEVVKRCLQRQGVRWSKGTVYVGGEFLLIQLVAFLVLVGALLDSDGDGRSLLSLQNFVREFADGS